MERPVKKDVLEASRPLIPETPLVLHGARQVGKTYLMNAFGKHEYKNCVVLNCDKDDRIAELEKQLEESGRKAKSGEDALKKIEALEAQLADEKVTHALEAAGCVNAKAAKALLDDYKGDVEKLKEACPYLFKKQTGSTGTKPGGAPSTSEERRKRAKEAIAGKFPARR